MQSARFRWLLALAGAAVVVGFALLRPRAPSTESLPTPGESTRAETVRTRNPGDLSIPDETPDDGRSSFEPVVEPPAVHRSASSLRPIVVVGSVTEASGKPFESPRAQIRVTDPHGYVRIAPVRGGQFSIDSCAAGSLDLGCEAFGFRPLARTVTLRIDEPEHREDFALEPSWVVAVRIVTTDGRSLREENGKPDAQLTAISGISAQAPGENPIRRAFSHRAESAWLPGGFVEDSDGLLDIFREPPCELVAWTGGSVVATKLVGTRVDRLTLEVPPDALESTCVLVGRVADAATGMPIAGVRVRRAGESVISTDARGEFRETKVRPGTWDLNISSARFAPETRRVELLPGRTVDLGTIALRAPVSLEGRFVDALGRPARARAQLFTYNDEHPLESLRSPVVLTADGDEEGRFEMKGCGPRRYLVRAIPKDSNVIPAGVCTQPLLVDLSLGPVRDVVFRVEPGVEVVLRPTTDPIRDLGYCITTTDSIPVIYGSFASSGVARERLQPGAYVLLLGRRDTVVRRIPFTVGQEPITVDVEL